MTAKRKHLILAKQRHLVYRERLVPDTDYRWWRYVDEEPAEGFVDTSYTIREFPFAVDRRLPPVKRRKSRFSNTQLRRRLSRSGIRLSMVGAALREVLARLPITRGEFTGPRYRGPLELSLVAVIGEHAARRVMVGVSEIFPIYDEYLSFASAGLERIYRAARSMRSTNSLPVHVQHLEQLSA